MILGFKDSLTEWTNKSLECPIKLGFFPKIEHKFPSCLIMTQLSILTLT